MLLQSLDQYLSNILRVELIQIFSFYFLRMVLLVLLDLSLIHIFREALTRLTQDQLVSYYSNIGVNVISYTANDLREIYSGK